jgi:hypothetical protein
MSNPPEGEYTALLRVGEQRCAIERKRDPDPNPRPSGPAPGLQELRSQSDEITRVASRHGARLPALVAQRGRFYARALEVRISTYAL